MAAVAASRGKGHLNRNGFLWEGVTHADAPDSVPICGGSYSCNVQGGDTFGDADFGGGAIEFMYSRVDEASGFHSIDAVNLKFSANGTYNLEIGEGFIKPVRTGGAAMDVDINLVALPTHEG